MNELDKIREEKGGAAAMLLAWVVIFAALSMTGCANKRYYFGVDDYGETSSMRHEFSTRGEVQPISRRGR